MRYSQPCDMRHAGPWAGEAPLTISKVTKGFDCWFLPHVNWKVPTPYRLWVVTWTVRPLFER